MSGMPVGHLVYAGEKLGAAVDRLAQDKPIKSRLLQACDASVGDLMPGRLPEKIKEELEEVSEDFSRLSLPEDAPEKGMVYATLRVKSNKRPRGSPARSCSSASRSKSGGSASGLLGGGIGRGRA